jgi:hypothetical protein
MVPGALPHPGRVPEQRLLSPEIRRWRRRSCRTVLEGFYRRRGIVRRRPGGSHHRAARPGAGPRPLMVRLAPGPPSGSRSVFGPLPGKIRLLELVSSNSENISCVAFLEHKNSRK